MENETSSQKTVINEYSLEELLDKLRNGSELSDEEMDEILCYVFFQATDSSTLAEQDKKKVGGLRVAFLTMAGKMCGRQTKFLPYILQYRKEAAGFRHDNYERVLEGLQISSVNVCRENVDTLVRQFDLANQYSETYAQFYGEVEESIDDGLASFAGFVGMESMISMDKQREKVLRLTKEYKK